jgi:hypothetical protein
VIEKDATFDEKTFSDVIGGKPWPDSLHLSADSHTRERLRKDCFTMEETGQLKGKVESIFSKIEVCILKQSLDLYFVKVCRSIT